jgi:hypothetical protein
MVKSTYNTVVWLLQHLSESELSFSLLNLSLGIAGTLIYVLP